MTFYLTPVIPGSLPSQRAAELCKPGLRRCGEIGRHEGLKIPFWRQSTGSTPVGGMDKKHLKSLDFGRAQTAEDADRRIREFMEKSGATHILTGTVADLKTEHKKFSGYGVRTDRVVYSLDLLVKVIDLKDNQIVFSGLVTGEQSQMNTKFAQTINDSLFQDLMKDAVKQAAEAMSRRFAADGK